MFLSLEIEKKNYVKKNELFENSHISDMNQSSNR